MEESTGAGGFQQELCKDAVVRRTFVLPQYSWVSLLGFSIKSLYGL